jgi:hypothetical protein
MQRHEMQQIIIYLHHDIGGRWGNVVWPSVGGEEWRRVELIAVTLGARRRGAKGGGWGCSRGPFYRAGDTEVGGRESSAGGH